MWFRIEFLTTPIASKWWTVKKPSGSGTFDVWCLYLFGLRVVSWHVVR